MAKSRRSRPHRSSFPDRSSYWAISKRPLQILAFLLPLIIAYEIGLAALLRSSEQQITVKAHEALVLFFAAFGVNATSGFFFLGGIVIVVVLLVWHLLNRDPWKIDWPAIGYMAVESLVLVVPLLVLGKLVAQAGQVAAGGNSALSALGLPSKLAISIGAGLYEELMFRMMLIAVLHTLFVDVGKASSNLGAIIAVVVSAAAFTAYHQPLHDAQGHLMMRKLIFIFLAGLYFGALYIVRGFGIVVAAHAFYDIVSFILQSDGAS